MFYLMTKYDVFYLSVMTSNVLSFVCLAKVVIMSHLSLVGIRGVACIVLQCVLHCRRYSSLCVVRHFSPTAFLCDTISMAEELLYSSRLPGSFGSLQILQCKKRVPVVRNASYLAIQALLI